MSHNKWKPARIAVELEGKCESNESNYCASSQKVCEKKKREMKKRRRRMEEDGKERKKQHYIDYEYNTHDGRTVTI